LDKGGKTGLAEASKSKECRDFEGNGLDNW
jgi:hypothetical protein